MTAIRLLPQHAATSGQKFADYAVLAKAKLSLLVLVTVATGYFVAVRSGAARFDWPALVGAMLGVALSAAGSAALNQYLEREFDALMDRTRQRPLPAGRMRPERALVFGLVCIVVGIVALNWLAGTLCAFLGVISVVTYVAIYTPLKRVTTFNTLVGAVTGALPPMIGWAAATGSVDDGAWMLFGILFVWQLPHFFAIAWLYREDYAKAGMRMLGVIDPDGRIAMRQILLCSMVMVPMSLMPAVTGLTGQVYFHAALVLGAALVFFGARLVTNRTPAQARQLFVASLVYLPCLLGFLLLDLPGAVLS